MIRDIWYESAASTFANDVLEQSSNMTRLVAQKYHHMTSQNDQSRRYDASVAFYYICVDKQATGQLIHIEPEKFSGYIVEKIMGTYAKENQITSNDLMDFQERVNVAIVQLGHFANKFFPETNEGYGGTLLWEFMKSLEVESEMYPALYQHIATSSLEVMNRTKKLLDLQHALDS